MRRWRLQPRAGEPTVEVMPVEEVSDIADRLREKAIEHQDAAAAGGIPNKIEAEQAAEAAFITAAEIVEEATK